MSSAQNKLNYTKSQQAFEEAQNYIPGGVNSPVRAFASVDMQPIFYEKAAGAKVVDIDGNEYLDFIGSWGPMILGHNPQEISKAVKEALDKGSSFGACCLAESALAKKMCSLVPGLEMLRFVSSGTEATMSALRLARGYTKRDKFIKFEGNYHGHSDALLVSAGSGIATFNIPGTPGVTQAAVQDTLLAQYNNSASVQALFEQYPQEIAAVIVEPIAGNMGLVAPEPGFLEDLRKLCTQHGSLLIFDEVISGFRAALGGAQELFGIEADIVCYGKIIGGGFPVGAFGGKKEIMNELAPVGSVYQAGTLSGNPIAMTAGLKVLELLEQEQPYPYLEELGAYLEQDINKFISQHNFPVSFARLGSLATLFFTNTKPKNWDDARKADTQAFSAYFSLMCDKGFLIAPSQFEALFISAAHTREDIERLAQAMKESLAELYQLKR